MGKQIQLFIVLIMLAFVSGCAENQTRIGEGAGIGAVLGAAAGGIIGHQTHDGAAGALIGGAIGAAGGAAVGAQIPKHQGEYQKPIAKVTMQQVVDWTAQAVPSDIIISRIRNTNSVYALTQDDVNFLRNHGVSERVIETMQNFNK